MRKLRTIRISLLLISVVCAASLQLLAQNPTWRTNRQARPVVNRLITNTTYFQREIQRNRYPWDTTTTSDERLTDMVSALSNSLTSLRTSLNTNSDTTDELSAVLSQASRINMFLDRNRVNTRATTQWNTIRTDVNTLAGYYSVAWNWNEPYPPGGGNFGGNFPGGGFRRTLTGTYRLNTSLSDNVTTVLDRSVGYYGADQRDRMRTRLERRLTAPETIVIDRTGRTITMGSSLQPQVTFDADGIARTETNDRGRTITTTVTSTGRNGFTVRTTGDRGNDFTVTFENDGSGRLRVTRQLYVENRNETISSTSVYDRIDNTANWTAIGPQTDPYSPAGTNEFYIPNGVSLTATLRNPINTRATQVGDRFTMEVISPNVYRGAVIEGHVTETTTSGRLSGRANLALDFDTISINGRQYAFAGIIDSVSSVNGDSVTVNNEGLIRDNNRTTTTATRAGIGALLGAVIGAVAGGGQGAAIGAAVGAGAGAGSVLVGGRDRIELDSGSTFRITASAPANSAYIRRQ
jgi:hypothetical protein